MQSIIPNQLLGRKKFQEEEKTSIFKIYLPINSIPEASLRIYHKRISHQKLNQKKKWEIVPEGESYFLKFQVICKLLDSCKNLLKIIFLCSTSTKPLK